MGVESTVRPPTRPRNDTLQYVDLRDEWWKPRGAFAMLHWIAAARAQHVPRARHPDSVLVDIGCGAGVLAPHVSELGHRHIGIDVIETSLSQARQRGVSPVVGDATALPLSSESADVVVAGEVLEHVTHPELLVAEVLRVLKPGGTLVMDTIADTWWGRLTAITVGERIPAGPPRRLHDGDLFIDRDELVRACERGGVTLTLVGLKPAALDYVLWLLRRRDDVRMVRSRTTAGLFQAYGRKVDHRADDSSDGAAHDPEASRWPRH